MRRVFPLILILILIGGLFALTQGMKRNVTAGDGDDDDDQQQQQKTPPAKPQTPPPGSAGVSDALPPEVTVGNPVTAKYKITLGWTYDEKLANRPDQAQQLIQTLQQWAQSRPNVSVEIVNLDVPASDLSPLAASVQGVGLAVNGSPNIGVGHFNVNISANSMVVPNVMPQIVAATSK